MAIAQEEIKALIIKQLPDAKVDLVPLKEGNDHYQATVISSAFKGLGRLQQHRLVYQALEGILHSTLHAFSLKTELPAEKDPIHE